MRRPFLVFGSIAAVVSGCAQPAGLSPSLCQIAATPHAFRGDTLTVEGVLLVSYHGSVIRDPACEAGVRIEWRGRGGGLAKLDDVVERELGLPPVARTVRIRVTGELRRATTPDMLGLRGWVIDLHSAEVLSDRTTTS